jgi:hypothetical protein
MRAAGPAALVWAATVTAVAACAAGSYATPAGGCDACPSGTYGAVTNASSAAGACAPCPPGSVAPTSGLTACVLCGASAVATADATRCVCLGLNRVYSTVDGSCVCRSGYTATLGGVVQTVADADGASDCQPIVYDVCYTGTVRQPSGACVSAAGAPTEVCTAQCASGIGTFNAQLGLCECTPVATLTSTCDSACQASAPTLSVDAASGALLLQLPAAALSAGASQGDGADVVEAALDPTDVPGLVGAVSCSSADNTTGSVAIYRSSCTVLTLTLQSGVFGGRFGIPSVVAEALTTFEVTLSDGNSSAAAGSRRLSGDGLRRGAARLALVPPRLPRSGRAAPITPRLLALVGDVGIINASTVATLSSGAPTVLQPVLCASAGDTIMFDLSASVNGGTYEYPVYDKDSLLNTVPDFDYGAFRALASLMAAAAATNDSAAAPSTFAFTFTTAGMYDFTASADPSQHLYIAVLAPGVSCPTAAAILPFAASVLTRLGAAQQSSGIQTALDYRVVAGLSAGAGVVALAALGSLAVLFRRASTGPALRKKLAADAAAAGDDDETDAALGALLKGQLVPLHGGKAGGPSALRSLRQGRGNDPTGRCRPGCRHCSISWWDGGR